LCEADLLRCLDRSAQRVATADAGRNCLLAAT
jgi:hypothetical protein